MASCLLAQQLCLGASSLSFASPLMHSEAGKISKQGLAAVAAAFRQQQFSHTASRKKPRSEAGSENVSADCEEVLILAGVLDRLRREEGKEVDEDLLVRVPSVQDRCALAGGTMYTQRNGWMKQQLLPILSFAEDGQENVRASLESVELRVGTGDDASGSQLAACDKPNICVKELRRLQRFGVALKHHFKIGRCGVTDGVVQITHNVWRNSELVKIRCHGPAAANMRETVGEIERKTGGIVIWKSSGVVIVYRGDDYEVGKRPAERLSPGQVDLDHVLERLGPRYGSWHGAKPTPVDGDLMANLAAEYVKPLRLLPCAVKARLSSNEQTLLRRAVNVLPPQFVVGNPESLEGLAFAVFQVWKVCEVVKIGLKTDPGVSVNLWDMAEKLERLTGGVLIAKNKDSVLLYRGKDFLPESVAAALCSRKFT